jgi:hypothetical protein
VTTLSVPERADDELVAWSSLGPQIVKWIQRHLVFGPGDLLGQPAKVDKEKRALIYRMYQVYPRGATDANGKPIEGRRRFRRVAVSLQKGSAKTELAAWLAAAELHPEAPVRCAGFTDDGTPLGRGVVDPYIPLVAYTEEQTEDLAYAALKAILERSDVAASFDIGYERIMRRDGAGKAVALAGAPDARDGARTTFAHKDETHRWTLARLKRAHRTMLANLPKRLLADPWELETTVAYSPGERSVAEETADYAYAVLEGRVKDSRLFYFHRQAPDGCDLSTPDGIQTAVLDAAGPTAPWRDIQGIVDQWQDPQADLAYLERVYLNRPVQASSQAFDIVAWRRGARPELLAEPESLITLGFDGSLSEDATALVATHVESGQQWPVGIWEKPIGPAGDDWVVPKSEVDEVVAEAFASYTVWRMYADPSRWDGDLARWAGRYGEKRVVAWPTNLYRKMATALKSYANAIAGGEVLNDGDARMDRHIANACRFAMNFRDDDDTPLWLIRKDRPGSPNKIDAGIAGCLSWMARNDAVASGALEDESSTEVTAFWA